MEFVGRFWLSLLLAIMLILLIAFCNNGSCLLWLLEILLFVDLFFSCVAIYSWRFSCSRGRWLGEEVWLYPKRSFSSPKEALFCIGCNIYLFLLRNLYFLYLRINHPLDPQSPKVVFSILSQYSLPLLWFSVLFPTKYSLNF